MIKIEKADNGYIVTQIIEDDLSVTVVEDSDDRKETFIKLCNLLSELHGFSYNKFGDNNFRCSFDKKGHKLE